MPGQTTTGKSAAVVANKTGQYVAAPAAPKPVTKADYNLVHLLQNAGFKGQGLATMYRVILAESGGRANAFNGNAGTGDRSYGLAQINMLGQMGVNRAKQYGLKSYDQLFDPLTNLKIAYKISKGGTNFSPWTTYTSGSYLKHAFDPNFVVSHVGQSAPGASGAFTPYSYLGAGSGGTIGSSVVAPSLAGFLGGDVVYQDAVAAQKKQLASYLASIQQQKANELAAYGQNRYNLGQQNTVNNNNALNSFGSRGIAHSSVYGDALTNIAKQYASNETGLDQAHTQALTGFAQNIRDFSDQQQNALQAAMAQAAARRAALYGSAAGASLGASAIGGSKP